MNKPQAALECAHKVWDEATWVEYSTQYDANKAASIIESYVQQRCAALWQPIETYVPSSEPIIVWAHLKGFGCDLARRAFVAKYNNGKWAIQSHPSTGCRCYNPTYWMPLPINPTEE